MRHLLGRLFLFLAEAADPQLRIQLEEYERERDQLLREISFQQAQVAALAAQAEHLTHERDEARERIASLERATAQIAARLGQDHTAGRSDADVLRGDLFGAERPR
jgi:chromosome segregation ATPase